MNALFAGIAPSIAVGVYSGATAAHTGRLLQTARTINTVTTIYGTSQAGYNISQGEGTVWDGVAVLQPASAGLSRAFEWVQCFEGDTPVVTDWKDFEVQLADGTDAAPLDEDNQIAWISAACGLLLVAGWPQLADRQGQVVVPRLRQELKPGARASFA